MYIIYWRSHAGPVAACSKVLESVIEDNSDTSAGFLLVQAEAPLVVSINLLLIFMY